MPNSGKVNLALKTQETTKSTRPELTDRYLKAHNCQKYGQNGPKLTINLYYNLIVSGSHPVRSRGGKGTSKLVKLREEK